MPTASLFSGYYDLEQMRSGLFFIFNAFVSESLFFFFLKKEMSLLKFLSILKDSEFF